MQLMSDVELAKEITYFKTAASRQGCAINKCARMCSGAVTAARVTSRSRGNETVWQISRATTLADTLPSLWRSDSFVLSGINRHNPQIPRVTKVAGWIITNSVSIEGYSARSIGWAAYFLEILAGGSQPPCHSRT